MFQQFDLMFADIAPIFSLEPLCKQVIFYLRFFGVFLRLLRKHRENFLVAKIQLLIYNCSMDFLHNIIEYYDELYPVTEDQKKLYKDLTKDLVPAKILRIGCATGGFEHWLAKEGHDVTGIETSKEMLETANRRRRMPNTAIRFFQLFSIFLSSFL